MAKRRKLRWDAGAVRGLRRHLAVTQEELAAELGVRQQTVSEWETGAYEPRGASERVLTLVAEQAGFVWNVDGAPAGTLEAGDWKLEGERSAGAETLETGGLKLEEEVPRSAGEAPDADDTPADAGPKRRQRRRSTAP